MSVQQSVEGKFATIQVIAVFVWFSLFFILIYQKIFKRVVSEIDCMQREQWNETLNNDVLLTRIENLERKLQVLFSILLYLIRYATLLMRRDFYLWFLV